MTTKPCPERIERAVEGIPCDCGGYADRDYKMTAEEIKGRGCGGDTPTEQCCARAFVCRICKTRWLGQAESPETRSTRARGFDSRALILLT